MAPRQIPEASTSPIESRAPLRLEAPPPEQSGVSLSGPAREKLPLVSPRDQTKSVPARPSIRDQIASLGSGLRVDAGKLADQTISLNDPEPRYNDYLNHLKARIEPVWYNLIRLRENVNPRTAGVGGQVHLVFTLNASGTLTYITLLEGSGFPMLDEEALGAVKGAAPFGSFPSQMGEKPFNIVASFYYNPHASRRP